MSIEYTNPNNKPFSSWIVSGKEKEIITDCVFNHKEAKKCTKASTENYKRIMAKLCR